VYTAVRGKVQVASYLLVSIVMRQIQAREKCCITRREKARTVATRLSV
jgi:hypothetical protein